MEPSPQRGAGPILVSSWLKSGLGNQMFQIAAALGYEARLLSLGLQAAVMLPLTADQRHPRKNSYNRPGEILSRVPRGPLRALPPQLVHIHRDSRRFDYIEIPPPPPGKRIVLLEGLFQSARFFALRAAHRALYEAYRPFPDFAGRMAARYPWFADTSRPRVAVHVRRGDYLSLQHVHHILPASYYAEAAQALFGAAGIANPKAVQWVLFSDDVDWCRTNLFLRDVADACFIGDEIGDQEALWLMAACDHHIIANSTFSWWGAYLKTLENEMTAGRRPPQVVVAPAQWFSRQRQPNINVATIYGPGWVVV